jgi:hypothetical protein
VVYLRIAISGLFLSLLSLRFAAECNTHSDRPLAENRRRTPLTVRLLLDFIVVKICSGGRLLWSYVRAGMQRFFAVIPSGRLASGRGQFITN